MKNIRDNQFKTLSFDENSLKPGDLILFKTLAVVQRYKDTLGATYVYLGRRKAGIQIVGYSGKIHSLSNISLLDFDRIDDQSL